MTYQVLFVSRKTARATVCVATKGVHPQTASAFNNAHAQNKALSFNQSCIANYQERKPTLVHINI